MRPSARLLFPSHTRLLVVAIGIAAFSTCALIFSGSPERRLSEHDRAAAEAQLASQNLARSTFGRTFLEVPAVDPTGHLTQAGLSGLDRGIDPGSRTGGLYPLRKAIEQLAGFIMWPLILISILHALVRSQGAADKKLLDVGIRFFTVVFMLWAYPLWDLMLYRGVAIPVTKALTNGELVRDVVSAIAAAGGRDDWRTFGDVDSTPTEALSRFWGNDAACATQLEVGAGDPRAGKDCFGPEVDPVSRAMHARSLEGYFPASDSAKLEALLSRQDPEIAYAIADNNRQSRRGTYWERSTAWIGRAWDRTKALVNPSEWLSRTLTGIFIQLQALLASIALWLIWLGVLTARAFSFCLAPIAIVWGLLPGGLSKAEKWFTGHAGIVLMPVGFAFGLLLFYAMQTAVFTTDMMTNAVIGVALKFAMFIALVGVLVKSGNLSRLIAGDVTAVAKDIGEATRNRTIQMAAAATAFAGGAALAGGSAVASSATAAKLAGGAKGLAVKSMAKPAAIMDSLARTVTRNKMGAADLAARFGLRRDVEGEMSRAPGKRSRAVKAAWDAVKDTANVARASVKGGVGSGKKYGWDNFAGGNVTPSAMRQFFSTPLMDAFRHMKESRQEKKERPTFVSDSTSALLQAVPDEAAERRETLRKLGLKMRAINAHDLEYLTSTMKVEDLTLAGRKWGDVQQGRTLANALLRHALAKGARITATANPDGTISLGDETVSAISRLLETDDAFRAMVMEDARDVFGGEELPMVQGRSGKVLDVAAWAKRSTAAANAIAVASVLQERLDREQYRRTLVSAASGSEANSLQEIAAHNVSHEIAQLLPDEDQRQFENRIEAETLRVLRMAWYEVATEEERRQMGLKPQGDHAAAAEHAGIDLAAWRKADSAAVQHLELGDRTIPMSVMVETIRRMGVAQQRQLQDVLDRKASHGSTTYGINELKFKTNREHEYTYMTDSLMDAVLQAQPQLKNNMERAYREAVREALQRFANQLPERLANETAEDYVKRIAPEINNFVFLDPTSAKALSRGKKN